jgi:hypothetical protein
MPLNVKQGSINFQFSKFSIGSRAATRAFKKLAGKDLIQVMEKAFKESAQNVYDKSQPLTPKDTGKLRLTGIVEKPSRESLLWRVKYGEGNGLEAPYARVMHDGFRQEQSGKITWFTYHEPGTQSHYLEQPFFEEFPTLQKNVFEDTKGAIRLEISKIK